MKTLSSKVTAAITGPVYSPAYLVQIDFSVSIRSCTRGSVEWNGLQWPAAGMVVGGLSSSQGAAKSLSITIMNNAFAFSQIVLAESAAGKRVRVWKLFGEAPYALEDAVLIFDGFVESVPQMVDVVEFSCSSGQIRALSIPNITLGPPFFNFIPKPGAIIRWNGSEFELQPR